MVWALSMHPPLDLWLQVWTKTPGYGENPFLETLWSSIEEVS
jgi:hypothetical protein